MAETITNIETIEEMTYSMPCDMRDEATAALSSGAEAAIEYYRHAEYNSEATHYIYFPNARRGGVCNGGLTEWTYCSSMDDLESRWENYEDEWSN